MTTRVAEPRTKTWTREEYYRLADEGWFQGQRVQLIEGEIIEMPPQKHPHALALSVVSRWARAVFEPRCWVREQLPLNIGHASDPEPDVAIVEGTMRSYRDHPTSALLIIEIADSSLGLDRSKGGLYAGAGIGEYWIVNVRERLLEIYREPEVDAGSSFGHRYAQTLVLKPGDEATPLVRPMAKLAVGELF